MSTFGSLFRVTTYGESHCASVGCIVDGCPPVRPKSHALPFPKSCSADAQSFDPRPSALMFTTSQNTSPICTDQMCPAASPCTSYISKPLCAPTPTYRVFNCLPLTSKSSSAGAGQARATSPLLYVQAPSPSPDSHLSVN